jgi:hypothetical protein
MSTQYRCRNEARRQAVRDARRGGKPFVNGMDFIEVSSDQQRLDVYFVHPLPGTADPVPPGPGNSLSKDNFAIEGGVRITNIRVVDPVAVAGNKATIAVSHRGDFSTYRLRLVTAPDNPRPPEGFDPQLSEIEFSFKASCLGEFDCQHRAVRPPERLAEPQIDYMAKDYASFRQLILDRLSAIMPDWRERNPADIQVALVELLAYVGDHLSYQQDAVATEAYLGTARKRISVRRHARLLDYSMHDGSNARAWIHLEAADDEAVVPAGTALFVGGPDARPVPSAEPVVFQTMHDLTLHTAHNRIPFHTWGDMECCLPRGATRAALKNSLPLALKPGDALLFEEVRGPQNGVEADADPKHRHVVRLTKVNGATLSADGTVDRTNETVNPTDIVTGEAVTEIEWGAEDALPFGLCVNGIRPDSARQPRSMEMTVARGNLVLADHGQTVTEETLQSSPCRQGFRVMLGQGPVTQQGWVRDACGRPLLDASDRPRPFDPGASASAAFRWQMSDVLPAIWLAEDDARVWRPQRDLLNSDQSARDFVAECNEAGAARLRFGDGRLGQLPPLVTALKAVYRVGNGRAGNVGAGAINSIGGALTGVKSVRNPLPATGGADPESLEQVRQFAPHAFRVQERAVTAADYAAMAERHPGIQRAAARFRWTGSWFTAFVAIDRKGGLTVDDAFKQELAAFLERYRLAGYDVEIEAAVYVPLDVEVMVCVKPGHFRADVKEVLLEAFSNRDLPGGRRGFFHPDNFTFGESVYLSALCETAMGVAGVASAEVTRLQRWDKLPNSELDNAVLTPGRFEIVRLDNDPNFPENGRLQLAMGGGV